MSDVKGHGHSEANALFSQRYSHASTYGRCASESDRGMPIDVVVSILTVLILGWIIEKKTRRCAHRTVDSGSAVDLLIYRCLSTSGFGHFGPVQLVLGINHFGHRHFPSLGVIPCEFRDDLYLSSN